MACPALPTCGLAVTESERSLPDINLRIRALMTKLGFDEGESFVVRMTGAPWSCPVLLLCSSLIGLLRALSGAIYKWSPSRQKPSLSFEVGRCAAALLLWS